VRHNVRNIAIVAGRDDAHHAEVHHVREHLADVVFAHTEGAADRHADDVHRVVQSARVRGVERKIDALRHGDAATRGGNRTTDLYGVQLGQRRRAEVNAVETVAAGGIGCEGAVPVEVE